MLKCNFPHFSMIFHASKQIFCCFPSFSIGILTKTRPKPRQLHIFEGWTMFQLQALRNRCHDSVKSTCSPLSCHFLRIFYHIVPHIFPLFFPHCPQFFHVFTTFISHFPRFPYFPYIFHVFPYFSSHFPHMFPFFSDMFHRCSRFLRS